MMTTNCAENEGKKFESEEGIQGVKQRAISMAESKSQMDSSGKVRATATHRQDLEMSMRRVGNGITMRVRSAGDGEPEKADAQL